MSDETGADDELPTQDEILEYATLLGIDPEKEQNLMWIAEKGIIAPLPENWKPIQTSDGDIYFFNYKTGESRWDHPLDDDWRELVKIERSKSTQSHEDAQSKNTAAQKRVTFQVDRGLQPLQRLAPLPKPGQDSELSKKPLQRQTASESSPTNVPEEPRKYDHTSLEKPDAANKAPTQPEPETRVTTTGLDTTPKRPKTAAGLRTAESGSDVSSSDTLGAAKMEMKSPATGRRVEFVNFSDGSEAESIVSTSSDVSLNPVEELFNKGKQPPAVAVSNVQNQKPVVQVVKPTSQESGKDKNKTTDDDFAATATVKTPLAPNLQPKGLGQPNVPVVASIPRGSGFQTLNSAAPSATSGIPGSDSNAVGNTPTSNDVKQQRHLAQAQDTATSKGVIQNRDSAQTQDTPTSNDVIQQRHSAQTQDTATSNDVIQQRHSVQMQDTTTSNDVIQQRDSAQPQRNATSNDVTQQRDSAQMQGAATPNDVIQQRHSVQIQDTILNEVPAIQREQAFSRPVHHTLDPRKAETLALGEQQEKKRLANKKPGFQDSQVELEKKSNEAHPGMQQARQQTTQTFEASNRERGGGEEARRMVLELREQQKQIERSCTELRQLVATLKQSGASNEQGNVATSAQKETKAVQNALKDLQRRLNDLTTMVVQLSSNTKPNPEKSLGSDESECQHHEVPIKTHKIAVNTKAIIAHRPDVRIALEQLENTLNMKQEARNRNAAWITGATMRNLRNVIGRIPAVWRQSDTARSGLLMDAVRDIHRSVESVCKVAGIPNRAPTQPYRIMRAPKSERHDNTPPSPITSSDAEIELLQLKQWVEEWDAEQRSKPPTTEELTTFHDSVQNRLVDHISAMPKMIRDYNRRQTSVISIEMDLEKFDAITDLASLEDFVALKRHVTQAAKLKGELDHDKTMRHMNLADWEIALEELLE